MMDLVKNFLTENDKIKIIEAVKKAEKNTAGEIVPMIVPASGEYPLSGIVGALALSVPAALVGAYFLGPLLDLGMRDMWMFLGIETLLFIIDYLLVRNVPWLKRTFTQRSEMDGEVRRGAVAGFYEKGLYRTRDETGVLIYISVFERMVWVLGDRGINQRVEQSAWNELVTMITGGIKAGNHGDAICRAVQRAGEILSAHFPIMAGDTDELPNLIDE